MNRAAVALCLFTAGCSVFSPQFEKPAVNVIGIEMAGGNFLRQNFLVKFDVQNPNNRALPVTAVNVELYVAGQRVASGVSNSAFVVPAHGEVPFDMTITANLALALMTLGQRADQHSDSLDYEMTGTASIDLPFLHDLSFRQRGSFPWRGSPSNQ